MEALALGYQYEYSICSLINYVSLIKEYFALMSLHSQITADPKVMTGMPCVKGTRVTVANIVRQIAAGRTPDEICHDYPYLTLESVRAALEFAADISSAATYELVES
ncbi:MAG: DUF433 domain-containing protein [Opitutaceae bacterium]|nr:DUF433 domain-containing protein [Opitutaceae bacterium]